MTKMALMILNEETGELLPLYNFEGPEDKWLKAEFHFKMSTRETSIAQLHLYTEKKNETHHSSFKTKESKVPTSQD